MSRLEVLCVAMHQTDFSLAQKLNLRCDAVLANQTDETSFRETEYGGARVKLVSTQTRGVGRNRNTAFLHASGEILLLSDDDMEYSDSYVEDILSEFDAHPDADVFIFNITAKGGNRAQKQNAKTKRLSAFSRMPYGAPRIAIRRSSWEKSNVWFTLLFGGGAKYTNGEDSVFLHDLKKKGLRIYVSSKGIGSVDMSVSSWYDGSGQQFFFNKGAYIAAVHPHTRLLWRTYHAFRSKSALTVPERIRWIRRGEQDYKNKNSKGTSASV